MGPRGEPLPGQKGNTPAQRSRDQALAIGQPEPHSGASQEDAITRGKGPSRRCVSLETLPVFLLQEGALHAERRP